MAWIDTGLDLTLIEFDCAAFDAATALAIYSMPSLQEKKMQHAS